MNILFEIILVLHLLGWALVLGGTLTHLRTPRIAPGVLHGILTALVTGLLMVGLVSSGAMGDVDPNNLKLAVKLVIAAVVLGLVLAGNRRPERVTSALLGAVAGLTVVNVAIAVLWR